MSIHSKNDYNYNYKDKVKKNHPEVKRMHTTIITI